MYLLMDGRAACAALAAWLAGTAGAQPLPPAGLPDLPYTSVFTRYQGFADQPVARWGGDPAPAGEGQGQHAHHHPAAAAPAMPANASPGAAPTAQPPADHGSHGSHGSHGGVVDHSGHGQHPGSKP